MEKNYHQHADPMYKYHDSSWHADLKEADLQTIQSVTKSIISTLFGIAIDRDFIASIDQKIVKYFPDHLFLFNDPSNSHPHSYPLGVGLLWCPLPLKRRPPKKCHRAPPRHFAIRKKIMIGNTIVSV